MKKIIIFSLIILFFTKTQNVLGKNSAFTVDNIEVVGQTKDFADRERHLPIVLKKAFEQLITGITKKDDHKELLSTNLETIKSLVANYRIIDEKISNEKYNLKAGVIFDRGAVERFLQKKNISYSEVKKLDIIIYPIFINETELEVLSKNKFFIDWNKNEDFENINFILPVENLDDIDFIKRNLQNLEELELSNLVDNYEIRNNAILILRYNEKKLNIFLKTNIENTNKIKQINYKLENLENSDAINNVVSNLKSYINELWKEENLIDISVPSYLTINTKFKDPESLKKIIEKIENISLIKNYNVIQLSNQSARIKIKFFGKIKNLQERLKENGFGFKILHNQWSLFLIS